MQPFIDGGSLILIAVLLVWWMVKLTVEWHRNRPRQQGFEVKLNAGDMPVPRKELNDLPDRRLD